VKLSPFWKSIIIGLSIGTIASSFVLPVFLFIGLNRSGMMFILYLYYVVGGLTGYFVYKYLTKNVKKVVKKHVEKDEKRENYQPNQELVNPIEYKQMLDKIVSLKKTSTVLKELVKTRKKLEYLKSENNLILEDVIEKMGNKSLDLTKDYLKTS